LAHPEDKYKIEKNAHHHIIDKTLRKVKVSEGNLKKGKQFRNTWTTMHGQCSKHFHNQQTSGHVLT